MIFQTGSLLALLSNETSLGFVVITSAPKRLRYAAGQGINLNFRKESSYFQNTLLHRTMFPKGGGVPNWKDRLQVRSIADALDK